MTNRTHLALGALVLALHGCLVPNTLRGRDTGAAPSETGADAPDALDAVNEAGPDEPDEADALDVAPDLLDATREPPEGPDASDAVDATDATDVADVADAFDAMDVVDAADVVDPMDVVDASDATDALDAPDSTDALDAADVAPEVGPDAALNCGPMAPFVTLDDLRTGLPMSWAQRRDSTGAGVTNTTDGAAQLAGGSWVRSTSCGVISAAYQTRVGGTWDLRAARTMRVTAVRAAVRTGLTSADAAGVECAYDLANAELTVRRRSGGAEATSPGNFLGALPAWIHMDVWDDGATVRCSATSPAGAHIEASLAVTEAPAGYVAFYTTGDPDRVAVLDDLVYERGLVPALHEYNLSEELATDPAVDRVGTVHGTRQAAAAVASDGLMGRALRGAGRDRGYDEGVRFAPTLMPAGTGDFTVSLWAYRTSSDGSVEHQIFGSRATDTGGDYFGMWMQSYAGGATPYIVQANLVHSSAPAASTTVRSSAMLPMNGWQHVAVVRSGGRLQVYVGGALTEDSAAAAVALTPTHEFGLGLQFMPGRMIPFQGLLDELRVYGVALTGPQVAALAVAPTR